MVQHLPACVTTLPETSKTITHPLYSPLYATRQTPWRRRPFLPHANAALVCTALNPTIAQSCWQWHAPKPTLLQNWNLAKQPLCANVRCSARFDKAARQLRWLLSARRRRHQHLCYHSSTHAPASCIGNCHCGAHAASQCHFQLLCCCLCPYKTAGECWHLPCRRTVMGGGRQADATTMVMLAMNKCTRRTTLLGRW